MLHLNENLIRDSFLRLRQTETGGKTGLERTSALMCFLALDALQKLTSIIPPVDLDPDLSSGKTNRFILTREVARLVQLKSGTEPYHLLNLGEVEIGGSPEKRFSSNFLTVSLKKATTSVKIYEYPSRPSNPLLLLGPKATGLIWGMDRHSDWKANLPVFLQGRKTKTPFTDLAIFVLRQRGIESIAVTLQEGLMDGLCEIFTPELCAFWKTQISLEKVYFGEVESFFQDAAATPFTDCTWMGDLQPVNEAIALLARITYLEGLLRMHHITFEE
jgi:hypothetical protein